MNSTRSVPGMCCGQVWAYEFVSPRFVTGSSGAPPEVMRRTHMEMLKHQRDETVHGGVRGARASLVGCVDCHASGQIDWTELGYTGEPALGTGTRP